MCYTYSQNPKQAQQMEAISKCCSGELSIPHSKYCFDQDTKANTSSMAVLFFIHCPILLKCSLISFNVLN